MKDMLISLGFIATGGLLSKFCLLSFSFTSPKQLCEQAIIFQVLPAFIGGSINDSLFAVNTLLDEFVPQGVRKVVVDLFVAQVRLVHDMSLLGSNCT